MSRTQILSIMENNMNKVNSVVGFNADNDGACFEFLFNKLSGNEKQSSNASDFDFLSELENASLFNVNNNELSNLNTKKTEESTYTLDDLLDLVPDIPVNANYYLDAPFDLLSGEPQTPTPYAEILVDTALASPLSASSEESCSLDDLLFDDESSADLSTEELNFSEEPMTEVLDSSNNQTQEIELINAVQPTQETVDINVLALALQNSVNNQVQLNTNDFNALYLFLQNQSGVQNESMNEFDVSSSSVDSPSSPSLSVDSPSSPSSSVDSSKSDSDEVRYAPYKRTKKQKTPEQRQRKKAQNRNAASRYRVKKKDQFQILNAEADELEEKNKDLKGKVDGLRTEIDYLKNLMLDVIKNRLAKGTLPESFLALTVESS